MKLRKKVYRYAAFVFNLRNVINLSIVTSKGMTGQQQNSFVLPETEIGPAIRYEEKTPTTSKYALYALCALRFGDKVFSDLENSDQICTTM